MARFFMDCEFIDTGSSIDLISIGIVCEDGRELYLQSVEFDPDKASPWVEEHVLHSLLVCPRLSGNVRGLYAHEGGQCTFTNPARGVTGLHGVKMSGHLIGDHADCPWRTREQIRNEIRHFFNSEKIELWGWCGSYDHVALCQLFGTMMDVPSQFPHYIKDLQYVLDEHGISDDELPQQEGTVHNALEDARHIKKIWESLHRPLKDVPLPFDPDDYPVV